MRVAICLTLLALTGLVQQEKPAQPAKPAPELYEDEEAYKIYAVLLPQDWTSTVAKASRLVIMQNFSRFPDDPPGRTCIKLEEQSKRDWQEVIDDYVKINQVNRLLVRRFPIEKPYILLTRDEVDTAFKTEKGDGDVWTAFYRHHPGSGGLIGLSAVGFNRSKDKAVAYMGHSCGLLCGGGAYYFLEKIDGKWKDAKVSGTICVWAS